MGAGTKVRMSGAWLTESELCQTTEKPNASSTSRTAAICDSLTYSGVAVEKLDLSKLVEKTLR
jgi:hypothetical protein